jgi:DNA-binding winged helix-turn-helix (wHTH) protein
MGLREQVMSLPAEDRLTYALDLLEDLSGQKVERETWLMTKKGLSRTEAKVLLAINSRSPNPVSREAIYTSVWCGSEVGIRIVDVILSRLRAKGFKIKTHYCFGYRLEEPLEIGEMAAYEEKNRGEPWSEQDDSDLIRMQKNGYSLRAMAYEMDRTERAVNDRLRHLRNRGLL